LVAVWIQEKQTKGERDFLQIIASWEE
jgi:hypothetical protein